MEVLFAGAVPGAAIRRGHDLLDEHGKQAGIGKTQTPSPPRQPCKQHFHKFHPKSRGTIMKQIGITVYTIPDKPDKPQLDYKVIEAGVQVEAGTIKQSRVFSLLHSQTLQIAEHQK